MCCIRHRLASPRRVCRFLQSSMNSRRLSHLFHPCSRCRRSCFHRQRCSRSRASRCLSRCQGRRFPYNAKLRVRKSTCCTHRPQHVRRRRDKGANPRWCRLDRSQVPCNSTCWSRTCRCCSRRPLVGWHRFRKRRFHRFPTAHRQVFHQFRTRSLCCVRQILWHL